MWACSQNRHTVLYVAHTADLVEKVSNDNYVGTAIVGKGGGPSAAYERRRDLMDSASLKELRNLVFHENPAVSLTAFQALCEQNDKAVSEALEMVYAKENVQVHVIQGDVSLEMSTLEYAYGYILGLPLAGKEFQNDALVDYAISPELQKQLKQRIVDFNSSNPNE